MMRTLFLQTPPREGETTAVLDALITDEAPSDDQIRAWLFGDESAAQTFRLSSDGTQFETPAAPEIDHARLVTLEGDEAEQPIGFGWSFDGKEFHPPPPPPRIVSGADFLSLFTPTEVAALWTADPRLQAGAMRVMAQNSANLSSPETHKLLMLAVDKGVLTKERADEVLSGVAP